MLWFHLLTGESWFSIGPSQALQSNSSTFPWRSIKPWGPIGSLRAYGSLSWQPRVTLYAFGSLGPCKTENLLHRMLGVFE